MTGPRDPHGSSRCGGGGNGRGLLIARVWRRPERVRARFLRAAGRGERGGHVEVVPRGAGTPTSSPAAGPCRWEESCRGIRAFANSRRPRAAARSMASMIVSVASRSEPLAPVLAGWRYPPGRKHPRMSKSSTSGTIGMPCPSGRQERGGHRSSAASPVPPHCGTISALGDERARTHRMIDAGPGPTVSSRRSRRQVLWRPAMQDLRRPLAERMVTQAVSGMVRIVVVTVGVSRAVIVNRSPARLRAGHRRVEERPPRAPFNRPVCGRGHRHGPAVLVHGCSASMRAGRCRAQDPALPAAAHRRPDRPRPTQTQDQDPGDLALGSTSWRPRSTPPSP